MRKFPFFLILIFASLGTSVVSAQKAPRPKGKPRIKIVAKPVPEPIVEEKWETVQEKGLGLSISFPGKPTVGGSVQEEVFAEGIVPYRGTTLQSYVNGIFYMVDVRTYPKDFLGGRTDLAEDFGGWLRHYVLRRVTILGERKLSYGRYSMVEFVYRQSPEELIIHRAVVVGDHLFQLMIQLPSAPAEAPEKVLERSRDQVRKFLESFHVDDPAPLDGTVGYLARDRGLSIS